MGAHMLTRAARALADRSAAECNVNADDNWKVYGEDFILDAGVALAAAEVPALLAALRAARDCISIDRTALADSHMDPLTNAVDEDGAEGVAEYDAVLAQIDAAIARAEGRS